MYLGVDIGGTKTLVATLNDDGVIQEKLRFRTPLEYHNFLHVLKNNIAELKVQDFTAAGVAVPGRIDDDGKRVIAYGNLSWEDTPVVKDVKAIVRCPVVIENDAKLAGLSEAMLLKHEYKKILYITVSTGIGIGVVVDGQIDQNLSDSGGKAIMLKHNGKMESWETFASGKAIVKRFGKRAEDIIDTKSWRLIAKDLAEGLIDLIAIVEPDVVVFGGGVGQYFPRFEKFLKTELKRYENPMLPIPPLRKAGRPEDAVVYGCYDLAKAMYGSTHS